MTEEDYEQPDCAKAGSFQTWWVKRLDGTRNAIVPLDKVELADLGTFPIPVGAFCSAHWFDFHPSGIVAAGFYGGGTQFLDVRNPKDIKSYGHATWGASEVWDSYWMPVYSKAGVMTAKKTNLAYSVDLVRGIDVYRVDLPGTTWDTNTASIAPVGSGWVTGRVGHRCALGPARGGAPASSYDEPRRRLARLTNRTTAGKPDCRFGALCESRTLCADPWSRRCCRLGWDSPSGWLLGSSWLSNIADGIQVAAGPLLVASETRDPLLVSLAAVLQYLPFLLFGLFAGVVADRVDRRRLVALADLCRVVVVAVLVGTVVTNEVNIALVLAAVFLLGVGETFADTTTSTLLPMIVAKRRPRHRQRPADHRHRHVQPARRTTGRCPALRAGAGRCRSSRRGRAWC